MSYATTGLRLQVPGLGSSSPALWVYTSTDPHGTVEGAGY
jgi:hypothetical protein